MNNIAFYVQNSKISRFSTGKKAENNFEKLFFQKTDQLLRPGTIPEKINKFSGFVPGLKSGVFRYLTKQFDLFVKVLNISQLIQIYHKSEGIK